MQRHEHFDLNEIESSIRKMFAGLPPAAEDNPTAQVQKQMVEPTVAFEIFKFDQANKGLMPDDVYPALLCWIADRIADMCVGAGDVGSQFHQQAQSLDIIVAHLDMINHYRHEGGLETSGATGFAAINPIKSGRA